MQGPCPAVQFPEQPGQRWSIVSETNAETPRLRVTRERVMGKVWTVAVIAIALLLPGRAARAAVIVLDGGVLKGATGVDVAGTLYNVQFVDNSCAAIFAGCDDLSDFDFSTQVNADAAGFALINQVFGGGDTYDHDPALTFGCSFV